MSNPKNKKAILLSKDVIDDFEYIFPGVRSKFCERAMKVALQDRALFEKIFFNPMFLEVK